MTDTHWLTPEQQRMWRLLLDAHAVIFRRIDEQLHTDSELGSSEYSVLVRLSEAPETTLRLNQIGTYLGWDRSRCSHLIRRMEKRGLVDKKTCAEDGRGILVSLTDLGAERLSAAAPGHADLVKSMIFSDLSSDDIETLSTFYRRIIERRDLGNRP
ncbi:MarR family winged helix-turn-helix transcriptional regulator [Corynebacterium aquilae]|uniref:HTH marR-type domain-containing protein n=1 Tax=Corynebacterium aquilae DSM 44791 TaxID=1431546 RepID=A0A1L7CFX9_9CORY|nr:MarR family transcriptional regulator [Corynebacterium aquilae]APT84771.1 hypothetical protein CAQU_06475 [Corynebacterium aquilae DSM 44791]